MSCIEKGHDGANGKAKSKKDPSLSNLSTAGEARPVHTCTCPLFRTGKTTEKSNRAKSSCSRLFWGFDSILLISVHRTVLLFFFPFPLNMAHGPPSPVSRFGISGYRILGRSIPLGPLAPILPGRRRMRFMVAKLHCIRRNTSDSIVILFQSGLGTRDLIFSSLLAFPP